MTAPEVIERLGQAWYGGEMWQQAPFSAIVAHVRPMVRHLTETEEAKAHRPVGESAHFRAGRLMRVYRLVQDFTNDDWNEVARYYERMARYYQGRIPDISAIIAEKHPECLGQVDLRI